MDVIQEGRRILSDWVWANTARAWRVESHQGDGAYRVLHIFADRTEAEHVMGVLFDEKFGPHSSRWVWKDGIETMLVPQKENEIPPLHGGCDIDPLPADLKTRAHLRVHFVGPLETMDFLTNAGYRQPFRDELRYYDEEFRRPR